MRIEDMISQNSDKVMLWLTINCKPPEVLETEIKEILKLWKYIKNLILMLKEDFSISCRLLQSMARETFDFNIKDLPDWLKEIFNMWYDDFQMTLCDGL